MVLSSDLKSPLGSNNLSSSDTYYWRELYKNYIAPSYNSIDMWYEDIFYGRVDQNNVAIYPSESNLKQLVAPDTIYAINFVADAWRDFREYIDKSVLGGDIKQDSAYSSLEPKFGWESLHIKYHDWNNGLYQTFTGEFMNSSRDQRMVSFKEFVGVYIEYIDVIGSLFPYTRESYILSRLCSPRISGLIIEIADYSQDADILKSIYLNDDSYTKVARAAKRYGFKIDKNAPWRFIADLDSNKMKRYMGKYLSNIEAVVDDSGEHIIGSKKAVFDEIYFRTHEHDLHIFKHYIWGWYNQYVTTKPEVNKVLFKNCSQTTMITLSKREVVSESEATGEYSDEFWIRLYVYICAKETRQTWGQPKFDRIVKKVLNLITIKDEQKALQYLSKEIDKNRKKRLDSQKSFTEEEINAIVVKRLLKKRRGTFKF